jgi:transposase InsO family protein
MKTDPLTQLPSHGYFRPTTVGQRELLFNMVEQTGNVSEAARRAHVGRGTYYYWRSRHAADGQAGLSKEHSRAPCHPRLAPVSAELRAEVLAYQAGHPGAGYRSIANGLCQAHDWQPVIGYTKVREIVLAHRVAPSAPARAEPLPGGTFHSPTMVAHASQPDQTANIDLCVVPLTHDSTQAMVSVSLSEALAGMSPTLRENSPPAATYPGQVFQETTLTYREQMQAYDEQRAAKRLSHGQRKHRRRQKQAERSELRAQSDELRLKRRRQRLQRQHEDAAGTAHRQAHRATQQAERSLSKPQRRARRAERRTQEQQWKADRTVRQAQQAQRHLEDAAWRQERQTLRENLAALTDLAPLVTVWLAILVVVDNGTRRCLGLPLFTAGVHVTADMIVAALRPLCPPGLEFLISDNGPQFIADTFAHLVHDLGCTHIRIAPHRPCTNGIAERFVRTLKEWLATRSWNSPEELEALLVEFIQYYNDRPHQGAELDGLSPNEFARRLINCSTC